MKDPTKWWLISDEDVQAIKAGLTGELLHTLSSGLHTTDVIPSDWGKPTSNIDFSFSRLDYEHIKSQEGLKDRLWEQIGKLVSETNELGHWDRVIVTSRIRFSSIPVKTDV